MERRKFVIGMGALASGAAAVVGTGAFSTVEAERSVEVDVEGDAQAYLELTGDEDFIANPNPTESELELAFGVDVTAEGGGTGFNDDAVTEVEGIVTIANQGTEDDVLVEFGENGDDGNETEVHLEDADVTLTLPEDETLNPGESVDVDVTVDTTDPSGSESEGDVTIYAEAQ